MQFSSILPIDRTLSGGTTLDQSRPGINGNKEVLHISQSLPGSDGNEVIFLIPQSSSNTGTPP